MTESPEILKLRVLLSFLNEEESLCTVTGLSEIFGEGKQKISRMLIAMEKEGLIDRTDIRHPHLTEIGRKKQNIIVNVLMLYLITCYMRDLI